MTDGPRAPGESPERTGAPDAAGPDAAALMRDWMTVVQTELAGLASDREALETWQALAAMWARGFGAPGGTGDPARAAAAAAASGAGGAAEDAGIAALLERIDALERRVAELERAAPRRRRGAGAG